MNIDKLREKYKKINGERFFNDIFTNNEYECAYIDAPVVLDVGACAGEFSAYIYPKAEIIYALEPYSEHFKELDDNVKEFELSKIKPFRLALSDRNGEDLLSIETRGGHRLGDSGHSEPVEVKTLATFMKDEGIEHIDLLKIDIEGGEHRVFRSPDFLEVASKIDNIVGEHLQSVSLFLEELGFKGGKTSGGNIIYSR